MVSHSFSCVGEKRKAKPVGLSRKPDRTVGMLYSFRMLSPWSLSDLKLGLGSQLYHRDPLLS